MVLRRRNVHVLPDSLDPTRNRSSQIVSCEVPNNWKQIIFHSDCTKPGKPDKLTYILLKPERVAMLSGISPVNLLKLKSLEKSMKNLKSLRG